jgi:hypothetical protein
MSNSGIDNAEKTRDAEVRRWFVEGAAALLGIEFLVLLGLFVAGTIWEMKSPPLAVTATLASINTPAIGIVIAWVFPRTKSVLKIPSLIKARADGLRDRALPA